MRVLSVENTRRVEQLAAEGGISYLQLMENAGSYCARVIRQTFENTNKRNVLVICGKGKNGGDGFVIARKLRENDYSVTVMMAMGFPADSESSEMLSRVRAMGIPVVHYDRGGTTDRYIENAQLLVDCIFGVGFYGEADAETAELFDKINSASGTVISVDVPSGLGGDGENSDSISVCADMTIAVLVLKPVHILKPTREKCGKIVLAPIGVPEKCFTGVSSSLFTAGGQEIKGFFKKRAPESHKGTYGTVLVIGGSYEMPNAVYFASQAAVNSGAGLVKVAFPSLAYSALAPKTAEQVLIPLESNRNGRLSRNSTARLGRELEKCSCVLIGCGMGVDGDTRAVTEFVIKNSEVPVILDADGINAVKDNINIIDGAKAPVVLTPHPGEMSRLAGVPTEEIQKNRGAVVTSFVKAHRSVLVLKGASTLVGSTDCADVYINTTGNPGMATGGSGDVLAGITASFIAQGLNPFEAAVASVYAHGLAGDSVSEKYSMMGNTPSLMLKELPLTLKKFE